MTDTPHTEAAPRDPHRVDPKLLEILVCPLTKQPLRLDRERGELVSEAAGLAFPIRQGVPIMLIDEARRIDETDPDPLAEGSAALAGNDAAIDRPEDGSR